MGGWEGVVSLQSESRDGYEYINREDIPMTTGIGPGRREGGGGGGGGAEGLDQTHRVEVMKS